MIDTEVRLARYAACAVFPALPIIQALLELQLDPTGTPAITDHTVLAQIVIDDWSNQVRAEAAGSGTAPAAVTLSTKKEDL